MCSNYPLNFATHAQTTLFFPTKASRQLQLGPMNLKEVSFDIETWKEISAPAKRLAAERCKSGGHGQAGQA